MPTCKECGDEVDTLKTVKVDGKSIGATPLLQQPDLAQAGVKSLTGFHGKASQDQLVAHAKKTLLTWRLLASQSILLRSLLEHTRTFISACQQNFSLRIGAAG